MVMMRRVFIFTHFPTVSIAFSLYCIQWRVLFTVRIFRRVSSYTFSYSTVIPAVFVVAAPVGGGTAVVLSVYVGTATAVFSGLYLYI